MSRSIATIHLLLHVAEVCLQMEAAITYYYRSLTWFLVITSLVVLPLVLTNLVSFIWVYRTMDFTNRPCGRSVCAILHLLQLGSVWRYCKFVLVYDLSDYEEFVFLRMVHALLQSAPYFVVQSYLILTLQTYNPLLMSSAAVALVSVVAAYSTFIEGNAREVLKEERLGKTHVTQVSVVSIANRRTCYIWSLQVIWRTCLITSRLGAVALFISAVDYWALVPMILHCTMITAWYVNHQIKPVKTLDASEWARFLAISYAQIIDLVNIAENERVLGVCVYYLLIIVENSVFTVMALVNLHYLAHPGNKLIILSVVYGGFIVGVVFMIIYHKCLLRRSHKRIPGEYRHNGYKHQRLQKEFDGQELGSDDITVWDDDDDESGLLSGKLSVGCLNPAFEPQAGPRLKKSKSSRHGRSGVDRKGRTRRGSASSSRGSRRGTPADSMSCLTSDDHEQAVATNDLVTQGTSGPETVTSGEIAHGDSSNRDSRPGDESVATSESAKGHVMDPSSEDVTFLLRDRAKQEQRLLRDRGLAARNGVCDETQERRENSSDSDEQTTDSDSDRSASSVTDDGQWTTCSDNDRDSVIEADGRRMRTPRRRSSVETADCRPLMARPPGGHQLCNPGRSKLIHPARRELMRSKRSRPTRPGRPVGVADPKLDDM